MHFTFFLWARTGSLLPLLRSSGTQFRVFLLTFVLFISFSAPQTIPAPTIRIPVARSNVHYTMELLLGGQSLPQVVVDTGSSDFYTFAEAYNVSNSPSVALRPSGYSYLRGLYVDSEFVNFLQCKAYSDEASMVFNGSTAPLRVPFYTASNISTTYPLFFGDWRTLDGLIGLSYPVSSFDAVQNMTAFLSLSSAIYQSYLPPVVCIYLLHLC